MKTNQAGLNIIKSYEKCVLKTYNDGTGTPTIGWGHTGKSVKYGMRITQEVADELFALDVGKVEKELNEQLGGCHTTENQFSAMVSLYFNLGVGWIPRSTVFKQHRKGNFKTAAAAFLFFIKSKGKKLNGLVRRRNTERQLYLS